MKAGKLEILGWALFDFANSAYTTVIVTVVYSVFFVKVIAGGGPHAAFLWSSALFVSELLVVLSAPVVGAMADASGAKKRLLGITYLTCVAATALLGFAGPGQAAWAWGCFVAANWAYSLGENLNSSFLPELSTPETMGRISGFAWGIGYLGGLSSLLLCVPFVKDGITFDNQANVRITAWITSAFFLIGGLPLFFLVKERGRRGTVGLSVIRAVKTGFRRVTETLGRVQEYAALAKFFPVYFLYTAGLSVVIAFSSVYAERTLNFQPMELMKLFIILQISACVGAVAFGWGQDRLGSRRTILITLVMWWGVVAATALCESKTLFLFIANAAGLAIGATASASRTYVGLLVPSDKTAEMYGFMGLFAKLASGLGALAFGAAVSVTGSQRIALAVPFLLFFSGFWGMRKLRDP